MKARVIAVLVAVAAIVISAVPATGVDCNWYNGRDMVYWPGYGYICSFDGEGCGECWNDEGDWCVDTTIPRQPRHHPLPP